MAPRRGHRAPLGTGARLRSRPVAACCPAVSPSCHLPCPFPRPVPVPETAAATLDRHCTALAACRRCALADPLALPIVSSAREARVMLVGQAPGQVETGPRGRPFSGRAGRTLFRWFERVELSEAEARSRIYFAAVTRCYPGPHASGRGDRVPTPRERANCRPWLDAELRIIRPSVLIPVGRLAVDLLFGTVALADVVGQAIPVEHAGGTSLAIALPHPSGASGWLNVPVHRVLLDAALDRLRDELTSVAGRRGRAA